MSNCAPWRGVGLGLIIHRLQVRVLLGAWREGWFQAASRLIPAKYHVSFRVALCPLMSLVWRLESQQFSQQFDRDLFAEPIGGAP